MNSRRLVDAVTISIPAVYGILLIAIFFFPFVSSLPKFRLISVTPELVGNAAVLDITFETNAYPVIIEVYREDILIKREVVVSGNTAVIQLTAPFNIPSSLKVRVVVTVAGEKKVDSVYEFKSKVMFQLSNVNAICGQEGLRLDSVVITAVNYGDLPTIVDLRAVKAYFDGVPLEQQLEPLMLGGGSKTNITLPLNILVPVERLTANHSLLITTPSGDEFFRIPPLNATFRVLQVQKEGNFTRSVTVEVENWWKYPVYASWILVKCDGVAVETRVSGSTFLVEPMHRGIVTLDLTGKKTCRVVDVGIIGKS